MSCQAMPCPYMPYHVLPCPAMEYMIPQLLVTAQDVTDPTKAQVPMYRH